MANFDGIKLPNAVYTSTSEGIIAFAEQLKDSNWNTNDVSGEVDTSGKFQSEINKWLKKKVQEAKGAVNEDKVKTIISNWIAANSLQSLVDNYISAHASELKGADSKNGVDGKDGVDGTSQYVFVRFSEYQGGVTPGGDISLYSTANSKTPYMGIAVVNTDSAPDNTPSAYRWIKVKGEPGDREYVHIRFSNSFTGASFDDNPTDKMYMGIYSGSSSEAPSSASSYKWVRVKGDSATPDDVLQGLSDDYYAATSKVAINIAIKELEAQMKEVDEALDDILGS